MTITDRVTTEICLIFPLFNAGDKEQFDRPEASKRRIAHAMPRAGKLGKRAKNNGVW
jgi:hypothetical protein